MPTSDLEIKARSGGEPKRVRFRVIEGITTSPNYSVVELKFQRQLGTKNIPVRRTVLKRGYEEEIEGTRKFSAGVAAHWEAEHAKTPKGRVPPSPRRRRLA